MFVILNILFHHRCGVAYTVYSGSSLVFSEYRKSGVKWKVVRRPVVLPAMSRARVICLAPFHCSSRGGLLARSYLRYRPLHLAFALVSRLRRRLGVGNAMLYIDFRLHTNVR